MVSFFGVLEYQVLDAPQNTTIAGAFTRTCVLSKRKPYSCTGDPASVIEHEKHVRDASIQEAGEDTFV